MARPRYFILYRFLIIETLKWFGLSFAFFFAIFLVNNVLLLAEDILSKSIGLRHVLLLLLFTIPNILSYTFPFSMLLATLIAAVRHASRFEFLAIQSLGISMARCYIPIGVLGVLFAGSSFVTNDYLAPRAAVGFIRLYQEIIFAAPSLELEPHSIRQYLGNIVATGTVEGNEIGHPLIIEPETEDGLRRVVTAQRANITTNQQRGVLTLSFHDASGHTRPTTISSDYDYFSALRIDYNILLQALNVTLRPLTPRELQINDVRAFLSEREPEVQTTRSNHQRDVALSQVRLGHLYLNISDQIARDISESSLAAEITPRYQNFASLNTQDITDQEFLLYETEYHRKISLPIACFFLTLFAFPVGIRLRRANWGIGFGVGLAASVVYWCLLIGGQAYLFQRTNLSVLLVMWAPNVVLALGGLFIYFARGREQ